MVPSSQLHWASGTCSVKEGGGQAGMFECILVLQKLLSLGEEGLHVDIKRALLLSAQKAFIIFLCWDLGWKLTAL